jgi:hypothetical protein
MFPPASLDLQTTVGSYEACRAGGDAWALGRLILPVSAVAEFADRWPEYVRQWPIALLLSERFEEEIRVALGFGLAVDVVECRLERVERIAEVRRLIPKAMVFVETPGGEMDAWLDGIAAERVCAKVRTGGVTAKAIPVVPDLAGFLVGCARRGLRFKATAGLHHAIRAERALTYEPGSARAGMHGFVNFFVAAAVAYEGGDAAEVECALAEDQAASFRVDEDAIWWRERGFSPEQMERVRERFAMSFGSCSFTEPLEEMRGMGWME